MDTTRFAGSWGFLVSALFVFAFTAPQAPAGWPPCDPFIRGDANADGGLDVSDAVSVLLHLFSGRPAPACMDALDANDDEAVDISDGLAVLEYLFLSAGRPPAPFPLAGVDESCNGADDDEDGDIDEGCTRNSKDPARYADRVVFLVSDESWHDVLRLIPAVAWTGPCAGRSAIPDGVCACPALIFHPEASAFDVDAVLEFLRRYKPDRIRLAGPIPASLLALLVADPGIALPADRYEELGAGGIVSHWSEIREAVLVENDYEKAIPAAVLASVLDAPLAIEGVEDGLDLEGKRVICVGDPSGPCDERLTVEEAQARFLAWTGTDRAILLRPDLEIRKTDTKATVYGGTVRDLFGRTSLSGALLAAYKRELPVAVHSTAIDDVDGELRDALARLGWSPAYLTIAASPLEIGQTIRFARSGDGRMVTWSIDNTRYGNVDIDPLGFAERKTGRIYGFTASDVSAYVCRASFPEGLASATNHLFIGQGVGATDTRAKILAGVFSLTGHPSLYRTYANPALPSDWAYKVLINNDAHGSPYYSTIYTESIPLMECPVVLSASCLTCAFDQLSTGNFGRLFCLQLLRQGALGVVASVDTAGFTWDSTRLNGVISGDLGTMFLRTQNFDHARNTWYIRDLAHSTDYGDLRADIQFLLGDPTLEARPRGPILAATRSEIAAGATAIEIEFRIESLNIEEAGTVYSFIEGTDDVIQARYGRFFLEAGPLALFPSYSVESPDVDPMFFGGVTLVAVQARDDGDHVHFMVEKDLSGNPLGSVVENAILIRIVARP